jgi:hypothetical protein
VAILKRERIGATKKQGYIDRYAMRREKCVF